MLVSFLFQPFCDVYAADVHGNNPGRCLICGDCRLVVCSVRIMAAGWSTYPMFDTTCECSHRKFWKILLLFLVLCWKCWFFVVFSKGFDVIFQSKTHPSNVVVFPTLQARHDLWSSIDVRKQPLQPGGQGLAVSTPGETPEKHPPCLVPGSVGRDVVFFYGKKNVKKKLKYHTGSGSWLRGSCILVEFDRFPSGQWYFAFWMVFGDGNQVENLCSLMLEACLAMCPSNSVLERGSTTLQVL